MTMLAAGRAARIVLDTYQASTRDPASPQLIDFYRSRRATVRAKLAAWHLRDPTFTARADWRAQAHQYLHHACRYARRALSG